MKNTIKALLFVLVAGLTISFTYGFTFVNNHGAPTKITVCHTPPGNPGNCHEISVSINALQAHLDHGDALVCYDPNELAYYEAIAVPTSTTVVIAY